MALPVLPDGLALVRTTPEFDEHTVPAPLLAAHHTAANVWGRLVVRQGTVRFLFENDVDTVYVLNAGESIAIDPQRLHRVILDGAARFVVEFHRAVE